MRWLVGAGLAGMCILWFMSTVRTKPKPAPRVNYYASTNRSQVLVLTAPNGSISHQLSVPGVPLFIRFSNQGWSNVILPNSQSGYIKQNHISLNRTAIIKKPCFGYSHAGIKLVFLKENTIIKLLSAENDRLYVQAQALKFYIDKDSVLKF